MFNPAVIKPAIGITVSFLSSRVVGQVIRANVATPVTTFQKVQLVVGSYAIGSAVGSMASQAVLEDIESTEQIIAGFKEQTQKKES